MIPVSSATLDTLNTIESNTAVESWQKQMANRLNSVNELLNYLNLEEQSLPYGIDHNQPFSATVTQFFASLIEPNNPFDPILLQVLPRKAEQTVMTEQSNDPLQESDYTPTPGLIHKYPNRALLIAHQACAIHCRYCFRRHYPYQQQRLTSENLTRALEYIETQPAIDEIILSGGDPMSLSDDRLAALLTALAGLTQLKTIRIHTRTPVVLPERITQTLLKALTDNPKNIVMVLHINHSRELSPQLKRKVGQLRNTGVTVLNQSVLLKDVNDSAAAQVELCQRLFDHGILPYYLHRLDKVSGAGHFDIDLQQAQDIWSEMQKSLSGYLLPRLVEEIPGRTSKTWENPNNH